MKLLVRLFDAVHSRASFLLLRGAMALLQRPDPEPPRSIIVLRNCFFGDYVVAIPALRRLREAFPDTRLILLTATSFIPGWRDRPQDDAMFHIEPGLIDQVVRYTAEDLRTAEARAGLRTRLAIEGPVAAVALVYAADSFVSRVKRIGLCHLLGLPWPHGLTGAHTLPAQTLLNRYRIGRSDITHQKDAALGSVDELLAALGRRPRPLPHPRAPMAEPVAARPVIGIAPFTKQPVKQWPLQSFAALMIGLHRRHDATFEIYGASADVAAAAELVGYLPPGLTATPMCGTLTPLELRERIERVAMVVALDSGPMHVASLVGTPVVAVFSQITLHNFWRPWGDGASTTLSHPVPCAACNTLSGECPLGTRACIEGVVVDAVLDSASRLLSQPAGDGASDATRWRAPTNARVPTDAAQEHPQ